MRDAELRFRGPTPSAGIGRNLPGGAPPQLADSTRADGSGAPAARLLLAGLSALLAILILAFAAAPASAALRHTSIANEFGPNGTSATEFSQTGNIAYQQANKRIYLQISGVSNIYGFSNPSPGIFTPLGGAFPLSTGCCGGDPDFAVDNSAGATANNIYYSNDENEMHGTDPSGTELAGWPVNNTSETCGVTVDNAGHIWGSNYGPALAREWNSGGASIGEFSTAATGNPCKLTADPSNNDMYVSTWFGPINRYTAASGYTAHQLFDSGPASNEDRLVVNGTAHKLYVAHPGVIKVYNTLVPGEVLEEIEVGHNYHGIAVNESTDTIYVFRQSTNKVAEIPLSVVPKAVTGEPTANKTVSGIVAPDGAGEITQCFFEFGESPSYGSEVGCTPGAPLNAETAVEAVLPGVEGEKTYHYRVVAKTASGTNFGTDRMITPHNVHGLKTEPATNVERTRVKLHGFYEGTGLDTHYYWEWGTTEAYGNQSAVPPGTDDGVQGSNRNVEFTATGLTAGTTYHFRFVGENSEGISKGVDREFTTLPPVSNVSTDPATEVSTSSATLHGAFDIDPAGLPLEGGDTHYYFEFGQTTSYGGNTAAPPGVDAGSTAGHPSVASTIEVHQGITYHYRIVVTNELGTVKGNDQSFTTPQPPTVPAITSANVTATTADLIARVNPNGAATSYQFEYGTTPSYGETVPIPEEEIGSGEADVPVEQHLEGLQVGALYHFRIVAHNIWGTTETPDQTFAFFTTNCPNAHLRQQTGAAYLPDCRAYELVSPGVAGAVQLLVGEGTGAFGEAEPNGAEFRSNNRGASNSFAFYGALGQITGTNPPNVTADLYLSKRTANGWETHYPGLEANQTLWAGETECDDAMDKCLNYDNADPLPGATGVPDPGSSAPYVFDANANSRIIGRFPSNVEEVEEGEEFIGDGQPSDDFRHFFFSSRNIALAQGGLTAAPGSVYDNNVEENTDTIVSKLPGGTDIPAGVGGPEEFIRIPAVSTDGSHVLMSTQTTKERDLLYMSVDEGAARFDITEGRGVNFAGMTHDGSKVFFTTEEQMTGEDTDESIDLYMWSEATGDSTLLSRGSLGSGNTNECSAGWVPNCDVVPVSKTLDHKEGFGGPSPVFTPDNTFTTTGDIYFYSPELLDGTANGFGNARNLYVYRAGHPQYVATLGDSPDAAVRRMDTTPKDSRVAFVTSSKLTGYNNTGHREMYTYDPGEPAKGLTCVSCIPTGTEPTSDVAAAASGRFMTDDGRTFYSTSDALVPFDTDGLIDIYEYVDGRPQLISSGTANQDTWGGALILFPESQIGFEGVSSDGVDVFFSTFQTLVAQDGNGEFIKFYDARTGGGFPFAEQSPPCKAADECHGAGSTVAPPPQIGTGSLVGASGNLPKQRKPCKKGFVRKQGKCVRKQGKKKHHKRSKRNGGQRHG